VYLLSCPVIPTVKRTGGIRPVTIGETLYKMAAVVALSDIEDEAVELLGPDQFALRPGGPESATIALKAALETRTGAATDIQNAFNTLDRV
jgi:sarcosine oxidase gamma subunit